MKRIFALLLLSLLLLTSCGGDKGGSDVSSDVSEEISEEAVTETDPLAVLPDADFEGAKTVIWTTDLSLVKPENAYDTALKGVMQERIDSIENKLNIEIVIEQKTSAEITKALQSGENCPDLVVMPSSQSAMNSHNGLYTNTWSLPYFADAAKALSGVAEEQTINNSLYMLTGGFNYAPQNTLVVYANRDLIEKAGMRLPSYAVADGTWTIAKMQEYIDAVSTVAGKPSADIATDIFGFTSAGLDTKSLINVLWNGSGIDYFGVSKGKPLYAEFDYALGQQATDAVKSLMNSGTRLNDNGDVDTVKAFRDGKVLFCITYFNKFTGNSLIKEFDWEILPLPKISEEQESYSSTLTEAMCISVPAAQKDSYRSGLVLSAWLLASRDMEHTLEQFYITYTSTDNKNTVMMQTIFDTTHYTLTELYSSIYTINGVGRNLIASSVTDGINLERYIRWQDEQMNQTAEKFK